MHCIHLLPHIQMCYRQKDRGSGYITACSSIFLRLISQTDYTNLEKRKKMTEVMNSTSDSSDLKIKAKQESLPQPVTHVSSRYLAFKT